MGAQSQMDDRHAPTPHDPLAPVVLADGRRTRHRAPVTRRRVWLRFGVSTAVALAVVLAAGLTLSARAAQREGISDVRRTTDVLASSVIEPNLTAGLLAGEPAALNAMDELVTNRLLIPTNIVRVKVWSADGRIVYSDAHSLIGNQYPLGDEAVHVLRTGDTAAEVSNLSLRENQLERAFGRRLLEVYAGVRGPDRSPLLFEAYFSFNDVEARRSALLRSFAWITLLGLFVFAGFQLSLGYTTVRWLHRERDRLLDTAMNMSENNRRRLASDLHDGIVQDLVGASYLVAGAAADLRGRGEEQMAAGLRGSTQGLRTSIQRLRSMIVDLYPATLRSAGLELALSDLAAPLRLVDIEVRIETPEELNLPEHAQTLIYRIVQEAFRNITHQASANLVTLRIENRDAFTEMEITDNGVGFAPGDVSAPGHTGLLAMADLAREAGAVLEVVSEPGHGTTVRMELPT
jgi:two-component system NarL family sensor kinase